MAYLLSFIHIYMYHSLNSFVNFCVSIVSVIFEIQFQKDTLRHSQMFLYVSNVPLKTEFVLGI